MANQIDIVRIRKAGLSRLAAASHVIAETASDSGRLALATWAAFVLAPTLLFFAYSLFWRTPGYVAEARLAVRGAQEQHTGIQDSAAVIGKLAGGGQKTNLQDSFIILNYLRSKALVEDLGGKAYFDKYFAQADILTRAPKNAPIESLTKYWNDRMVASVDTPSALLTFQIEAFKPEDARAIALDLVAASEKLVNQITLRNRADAVQRARAEVDAASQKLAEARNATMQFRNKNTLIDPKTTAESLGETIAKLTTDKITIENALASVQGAITPDAPGQRVQRARLAAINAQIDEIKQKLAGLGAQSTLSSQIATYEKLKLDEQFDEKVYVIAQNAYLRAMMEQEKQQLYVVVAVAPTVPQEAYYPRVWKTTPLLFASLFALWMIGVLLVASVRDQML
jgi:capsular polysaccharide transport system permease protein